MEHGIVNAREVATAAGLMFFGSQGKGIRVDTSIGVAGVVLEGLDNIEVRSFAFREAVLAVELELGSDHGVLAPTVHVKGSLSEHEGASVRHKGAFVVANTVLESVFRGGGGPGVASGGIDGTSHLEEAGCVDEARGTRDFLGAAESVDGVGESIDSIGVVEGLGTEGAVEEATGIERRAVVNVSVGLHDPDQFLAGVVKIQLDLVGGGSHGFIASELDLFDEVFVGVLGHLAALVGVKEDVVNVEGSGNKGLLVGLGHGLGAGAGGRGKGLHGPEALANGAEINVDLDFVVLEGDAGEGKAGVAAEPEEEGNVEGGLREGVAGSAHLGRSAGGSAGARDGGEGGVSDVGKLGGVTNHLEVAALLLLGEGQLVPDVHPVTILAVNALATDFNFDLRDELFTDVVQPASIDTVRSRGGHRLVDFGEGHLEVGAVGKIAVTGDRAGHTAAEIGLAGEGLFDGFHCEVGVASVRHLPEGNFGGSREEHVLGAIGDELHKSTSHSSIKYLYAMFRKKFGEMVFNS